MFEEFKKFAFKGNVIDMSVCVIIGGAFSKIVTSVVNDVIMPIMGKLTGGINLSALKLVLSPAQYNSTGELITPESAILYGSLIQNIIDFLIIAFCIFIFVRAINKLRKKEEKAAEPVKGPTQEELLTEIRDLLKK